MAHLPGYSQLKFKPDEELLVAFSPVFLRSIETYFDPTFEVWFWDYETKSINWLGKIYQHGDEWGCGDNGSYMVTDALTQSRGAAIFKLLSLHQGRSRISRL